MIFRNENREAYLCSRVVMIISCVVLIHASALVFAIVAVVIVVTP